MGTMTVELPNTTGTSSIVVVTTGLLDGRYHPHRATPPP
jgi:hypothetical protein